jgi:hypothetical protein
MMEGFWLADTEIAIDTQELKFFLLSSLLLIGENDMLGIR